MDGGGGDGGNVEYTPPPPVHPTFTRWRRVDCNMKNEFPFTSLHLARAFTMHAPPPNQPKHLPTSIPLKELTYIKNIINIPCVQIFIYLIFVFVFILIQFFVYFR